MRNLKVRHVVETLLWLNATLIFLGTLLYLAIGRTF